MFMFGVSYKIIKGGVKKKDFEYLKNDLEKKNKFVKNANMRVFPAFEVQ